MGMPTLVDKMHGNLRKGVVLFGEVVVIAFFSVLAWAGVRVFSVLGGTTLVSLPWVPTVVAQSVIPIGAVLFIVSQLLSLPDALREPVAEPDEEFAYVATAEADGPASSGADA